MLLPFTDTKHPAVCERALARIGKLADLMASSSSVQVWRLVGDDDSSSHHGNIHGRFLGQLLGHLIVCWTSKIWEIQREALDVLHHLSRFIQQQKRMTSPGDNPEHSQRGGKREAGNPSWLSLCSTRSIAKAFGEYLHPADKTVILLKAIEAMRDSCVCDKEELITIVDEVMTEPASWLTEVPIVMSCIYNNMEHISAASARCSLDLLLLKMAELCPGEAILSLVDLSPACDSVARAMLEVLLSQPLILEKVLRELSSNVEYLQLRWTFNSEKAAACIEHLVLLVSSNVTPKMFAGEYNVCRPVMGLRPVLLSVVLRGLITLSQLPDTARKMLVLVPDLMDNLHRGHNENNMKILLVFRNVMGHLKKKASSTALQLAEKLLKLFDDECSQVRELSICLFKDIIQMADWKDQRQMLKKVRRSLVPLMLHMSDEAENVAKASHEALCVAVKLLKWKRLSRHVEAHEIWRTVESLLEQDRSRAEEYMHQSLPYLRNAQVTMRVAAVRFIGLAARYLKDSSVDMLQEICDTLQCLAREEESQVSSLASQTINILTVLRMRRSQGLIPRRLCFWL
ncbi:maestro heat-like repeat family member 5 [Strigops habroptila]|uniref:maestro heat-like repeat family member 5 n=1 Tax=Strigops habroptila TaxID=2489341 RepID=UPI0011CF7220|nr:maestro heat-like repeat family member 5 [Strigops habroptila]